MTDSMNFGPEWLRNLSSEGTTTGMGGGGSRCQLADYRYGREDMLALYEKGLPPPQSLTMFPPIYSEQVLPPLALVPPTEEERQWAARATSLGPSTRGGRGAPGIGERGGRGVRGARGAYQPFGRALGGAYDGASGGGGWIASGEQPEWSPRKDFTYNRSTSSGGIDNWRRNTRTISEDEDGWRTTGGHGRGGGGGSAGAGAGGGGGSSAEKWTRSSSWREGEEDPREKRWHEPTAGGATRGGHRRMWDAQDDHLPEWATENLAEGGGTFDSSGAFHGSDDEHERGKELQKSASQHNIRNQHAPLVTSKSAVALSINKNNKIDGKEDKNARYHPEHEEAKSKERTPANVDHAEQSHRKATHPIDEPGAVSASAPSLPLKAMHTNSNSKQSNNTPPESGGRVVDEDFDKLQEDFVSKLVVDEEPPKNVAPPSVNHPNVGMSNGIPAPPPNLIPPPQSATQEKWYYQDPQGDLQGPFLSSEMAEWFKAGYFSTTLFVRRQCDERFYTLGELVSLSSGNPFLASVPVAPPKQEKFTDPEMAMHYQQQFLQAQMMRARPFGQEQPWAGVPGFQGDRYPPMMPPMGPEMMQQSGGVAPMLHHMLNQFKMPPVGMQQAGMDEPLAASNSMHLDPLRALVQQMGGLQSLQSRLQPQGMPPPVTHGMPTNGNVQPQKADAGKMEPTDFMQFMQQHAALGKSQQAQMEQRIDLDSLWKRNQFQQQQQQQQVQQPPPQLQQPPPQQMQQANNLQAAQQWPQSDKPISMWDPPTVQQVHQGGMPPTSQPMVNQVPESPVIDASEKKNKKEEKRLKELEEKHQKKEAEEKRKQEQRKQEMDKKQQEEKRKKEEERIQRELEKAKKEAEEKRLKELAEKKRLKEQRKEEEARKKAAEELKKQEDEKERLAAKERSEELKKAQAEEQRQLALAAATQKPAKIAPWSQATSNQGLSLSEIQKIERERKTEQVLMLQQQAQQRQLQLAMQEQVASPEKMNTFGVPLNWANKPMRPNHVKSLAEIQAEEQDRMSKQKEKEKAAQKEKETLSPPTSTIWCGQSLTWNNSDGSGFWEEPVQHSQPPPQKKPQQAQPVKQAANRQQTPQQQAAKKQPAKQKEQANNNANSEVNSSDEFTNWCIRTLASMNTQVDIPTFVSFLRSIESALDVRDYCREYLGEKPATQQFAAQFLEKRRSFKPKPNAHKDDMCSPAPAITPSSQHNSDFQEVKGKGKKVKKSKMLKVDARILGFSVTAAQDRINVGDRDYGES